MKNIRWINWLDNPNLKIIETGRDIKLQSMTFCYIFVPLCSRTNFLTPSASSRCLKLNSPLCISKPFWHRPNLGKTRFHRRPWVIQAHALRYKVDSSFCVPFTFFIEIPRNTVCNLPCHHFLNWRFKPSARYFISSPTLEITIRRSVVFLMSTEYFPCPLINAGWIFTFFVPKGLEFLSRVE